MSSEKRVDVSRLNARLRECTAMVKLTAHTSFFYRSEDLESVIEADEEFRAASAELRQCEDDSRFDDVYLAALSRHTRASASRLSALANIGPTP